MWSGFHLQPVSDESSLKVLQYVEKQLAQFNPSQTLSSSRNCKTQTPFQMLDHCMIHSTFPLHLTTAHDQLHNQLQLSRSIFPLHLTTSQSTAHDPLQMSHSEFPLHLTTAHNHCIIHCTIHSFCLSCSIFLCKSCMLDSSFSCSSVVS